MSERKPLTGWLVPDGQDASHEEHGDWYRAADVAALEAENARLRDQTRLRPMSEAPKHQGIWVLYDFPQVGHRWLHRFPPKCPIGAVAADTHAIGWTPLPEATP